MIISFKSKKLQKICSKHKAALKELGQNRGKKLMQRMLELNAAIALSDISHLPPARLHELTGNRKGQFSVDLEYPYRLLFIPNDETIPIKKDGGLDKANIHKIKVIEIEDTH